MKPIQLQNEGGILIFRDDSGILHVEAESEADLYFGQGYAQALDRGLQLLHTRILGRGQASEFLSSSEQMLRVDRFFRKMNLAGDTPNQAALVNQKTRPLAQAFCDGINHYFATRKPWELRFMRYRPPVWKIEDCILVLRVLGYVNMQLSQNALERLIIDLAQADLPAELLEDLFPGQLAGLDLSILRKIKLTEPAVQPDLISSVMPRNLASDNWVVAPRRSASGAALLANDAHVQTSMLPGAWQEISLKLKDRYLLGACLPGFPGVLNGRNNDLSWGATYSHMDTVDSWVEECREGKFKRGSATKTEWVRFHERREIIRRRGRRPEELTFYENEHGVLDGRPQERGYYLTTRWAGSKDCGARSIDIALGLLKLNDVKGALDQLGQFEIAMNWVLADASGNIGYQMSGRLPRRRAAMTGLLPLPGWDARNDWKGFVNFRNLPRKLNPREGYFVAAGRDLNRLGKARPINLNLASYRTERISHLLKQKGKLTPADLILIQRDDFSLQAERIMKLVGPHLPSGEAGDLLRAWDFRYDKESKAAVLFETLYQNLIAEVLSAVRGIDLQKIIRIEDVVFLDYFASFDNILYARNPAWFQERSREDCLISAVESTFSALKPNSLKSWGEQNQVRFQHILFGRLPGFLNFRSGALSINGARATPHQGQIHRGLFRDTACVPAFRMIVDLSEGGLSSSCVGGPSDRRFSRYFRSELNDWLEGVYKAVSPHAKPETAQ